MEVWKLEVYFRFVTFYVWFRVSRFSVLVFVFFVGSEGGWFFFVGMLRGLVCGLFLVVVLRVDRVFYFS